MPSITIDPGVIAAPSPDVDRTVVKEYVDTLLDWSSLLEEEAWVRIYMSERASEILLDNDLYPFRPGLKELFRRTGTTEYDYNTVARVADTLLARTHHFESKFQVRDWILC